MRFVSSSKAGIAIYLHLSAVASSESISSLPHCWQNCISINSPSCGNQDLSCICSLAGAGSFLSDTASCINDKCFNDDLDHGQLIAPLQVACNANGTPIPSSAIGSRSLSPHRSDTTEGTTTTTGLAYFTDRAGNTHTLAVPLVIGASTTEYGNPVTVSGDTSSSTSTASASSSVTSNISIMGLPKSTIPSVSSTTPSTIAPIATPIASSTISAPTSTTSSSSSSSSSQAPSSTAGSGSLLDLQGAGMRREASSLLGLILGVVAGVAWF